MAPRIIIFQKVIANLRAINKLDENKWRAIKIKIFAYSFIPIFSALLFFPDTSNKATITVGIAIILVIVLPISVFLSLYLIKRLINKCLLYTVGEKAIAEVTFARIHSYNFFTKRHYFYYSFSSEDKKYNKKNDDFYDGTPEEGDRIEILYLKGSPKIATPFWLYNQQKYNLKIIP